MKKYILPVACAFLLVQTTSCINTEREVGTSKNAQKVFTPTPEGSRARLTERSVLRTVNASHYFSNTKTKDNFVLQLRGTKIATAQANFIILSSKGDTLRKEVMPASALINERDLTDPAVATTRDKEIAILQGMNTFFRDDRFVQPAIPKTSVQPQNVDVLSWSSVKDDNKAVGFDYIGSGGRERRLAYSKKLSKAVVIAE
ncbi:hypothetical protein HMJ29_16835 [Hymenobacter taeanensis]|uniref:Uncharacterized protein n=1 Tax=Hymenobacter taeanensis TaxID=2735321 RepID=A0A6M6BKJ9_9BACT|nr:MULTISPECIES: hypothetical protein [Hymenobacter]QJX48489.1 hypothetical protein HMJ29_16835 [Hymenobacter taeanensis]UOQ82014.1 hypothetical protein MUN83_04285 [Hymenobacter sp. 5414T-23]